MSGRGYFFFYGTLAAGSSNPVARTVHRRLGPGVRARVRGRLLAIPDPLGWYPAFRPGAGVVHGMVYRARHGFGVADIALIDGWEGADYDRVAVIARTGRGALRVQAYLWCGALPPRARPISGGNFARWLAQRRVKAFGENTWAARSRRAAPRATNPC